MEIDTLRQVFRLLNKFIMVPLFRLGLGALVGNPLTGYIMVIQTVGRKTGRLRYTPVNYALMDGYVYCMSGWGAKADWHRNLMTNPRLEVILPGGNLSGAAEVVAEPGEWLRAARQLLKNAGLAGFLSGVNPFTASDEQIRQKYQGYPIMRIRPTGIGSGPADPGGWFWLLTTTLAFLWVWRKTRRK